MGATASAQCVGRSPSQVKPEVSASPDHPRPSTARPCDGARQHGTFIAPAGCLAGACGQLHRVPELTAGRTPSAPWTKPAPPLPAPLTCSRPRVPCQPRPPPRPAPPQSIAPAAFARHRPPKRAVHPRGPSAQEGRPPKKQDSPPGGRAVEVMGPQRSHAETTQITKRCRTKRTSSYRRRPRCSSRYRSRARSRGRW